MIGKNSVDANNKNSKPHNRKPYSKKEKKGKNQQPPTQPKEATIERTPVKPIQPQTTKLDLDACDRTKVHNVSIPEPELNQKQHVDVIQTQHPPKPETHLLDTKLTSTTTISVEDLAIEAKNLSISNEVSNHDSPKNDDVEVINMDISDEIRQNLPNEEPDDGFKLPKTVSVLTTANGSEVYLIGTAHFSLASVQDVQKVIQSIQPSVVVLELCSERKYMLEMDEETFLQASKALTFSMIRKTISEKGLAQGLLFVMFVKISASLTEELGVGPGCEFRAAYAEARKIPNCNIILGDRSIRVTIARAVDSLTLWEKLKLAYQITTSDLSMTQEDVEKAKEKDILEQWLDKLDVEFPGFTRALLDERNMYLAHSIHMWASRTSPLAGSQKVVAVVGIGHVAGIAKYWGKTTNEDINKIVAMPTVSKTRVFVGKTIKYGSLALLVYFTYRVLTPSSIQSSVGSKVSDLIGQVRAKLQSS